MDYKSASKRVQAAMDLLQKREINGATIDSLKTILSGINPQIDRKLLLVTREFKKLEKMQKGQVIDLVAEALPEFTPEQKKKKKALLLFLKFWNDLKSEVTRVESEFEKQKTQGQSMTSAAGNIFSLAKGPLGIVTLIAVGIVALKMTEVSVIIKNTNCKPMTPMTSAAVNIPGLKLPNETIPAGGQAVAKLPPFRAHVDGTAHSSIRLTVLGISYTFDLESSGIQLVFDGNTLNDTQTTINLGSSKEHTLTVVCR